MNTSEFSDRFTTALNSHAIVGQFGEGSSKAEVVLDEYEKSVFLTQAQDLIVKSYFDRTLNSQGQGFDDTPRRQVDFSSLIKVAELQPIANYRTDIQRFDWKMTTALGTFNYGKVTIQNLMSFPIRVVIHHVLGDSTTWDGVTLGYSNGVLNITMSIWNMQTARGGDLGGLTNTIEELLQHEVVINGVRYLLEEVISMSVQETTTQELPDVNQLITDVQLQRFKSSNYTPFDNRGILFQMPMADDGRTNTDVLFILNEKMIVGNKDYVIIPISHQEYDREMSKPYSQPLKKQAWRLFQNMTTGFDVQSELIPKWTINAKDAIYKVRYVCKPKPIVLENMPDDLSIDGVTTRSECELHPILHMDILNKAVELAIASRGYNVKNVAAANEKA